jgi:membrane protein implicated in regulation of membrane protease activity
MSFDPELMRWGWFVFALVLFVLEIVTTGFVLAAFGVGAVAAGIVAVLGIGLQWQLAVFAAVSGVSVLLSRRFAERVTGPSPEKVGVDRVLGKTAVVLEAIEPVSAAGRVRVEREQWRAQSADGQPIPTGTMVEVIGVEGTRLVVRAKDAQDS